MLKRLLNKIKRSFAPAPTLKEEAVSIVWDSLSHTHPISYGKSDHKHTINPKDIYYIDTESSTNGDSLRWMNVEKEQIVIKKDKV